MNRSTDSTSLARSLDAVLPQTQCTKCGFDGCMPYARAMADGQAPINRCPPGGVATIQDLASILHLQVIELDTSRGEHKPIELAVIDERLCIGCTLCIAACPVDAILGAPKQMHSIVARNCSGCELCIAPCPVDCISMQPSALAWDKKRQQAARTRHEALRERLERIAELKRFKRDSRLEEHGRTLAEDSRSADAQRRRESVEKALERARARRAATP